MASLPTRRGFQELAGRRRPRGPFAEAFDYDGDRGAYSGSSAGPGTIGTIVIDDTYWRASPWRSAQALIAAASSSGRSSGEWWPARPWQETSRPAMFSSHQATAA